MTEERRIKDRRTLPKRSKLTYALLFLTGLVAAASLIASGWALVDRFYQTNSLRAQQSHFNVQLAALANANCLDIEQIKSSLREQENQNFNHLDRNLRLLGIKKTPEIVRVASKNHAKQLERLKKAPCPRKPKPKRPTRR